MSESSASLSDNSPCVANGRVQRYGAVCGPTDQIRKQSGSADRQTADLHGIVAVADSHIGPFSNTAVSMILFCLSRFSYKLSTT